MNRTFRLQKAAIAIGDGLALSLNSQYTSVLLEVSGISGSAVVLEGRVRNGAWVAILVTQIGEEASAGSITANGLYYGLVAGLDELRARISVYGSGAITVSGKAFQGDMNPAALSSGGGSGSLTATSYTVTISNGQTTGSVALTQTGFSDRIILVVPDITGATVTVQIKNSSGNIYWSMAGLAKNTTHSIKVMENLQSGDTLEIVSASSEGAERSITVRIR